jgi:hypothetical protein
MDAERIAEPAACGDGGRHERRDARVRQGGRRAEGHRRDPRRRSYDRHPGYRPRACRQTQQPGPGVGLAVIANVAERLNIVSHPGARTFIWRSRARTPTSRVATTRRFLTSTSPRRNPDPPVGAAQLAHGRSSHRSTRLCCRIAAPPPCRACRVKRSTRGWRDPSEAGSRVRCREMSPPRREQLKVSHGGVGDRGGESRARPGGGPLAWRRATTNGWMRGVLRVAHRGRD